MKTLSLFDGISCGRVALERAGIPVTRYYASEIDKHAIVVSRRNYPDIIQLGDVRAVRQMAENGLFGHIDLVIGGSPCQGFSFAGDQLAFDDPRSALFWEYIHTLRALQRINPNIRFMLENVRMKKEHLDVITNFMGVKPVRINSALVSAQNRDRYYWCNWSVSQPIDRGIYLRDIIQTDGDFEGHALSDKALTRAINIKYSKPRVMPDKTGTLNVKNNSGQCCFDSGTKVVPLGFIKNKGTLQLRNEKAMCLDANYYKGADNHGQRTMIGFKSLGHGYHAGYEREVEKSPPITSSSWQTNNFVETINTPLVVAHTGSNYEQNGRMNSPIGKSPTLLANEKGGNRPPLIEQGITYRKLTPIECERLQTLPDDYTAGISNTQRYKTLGNGWTVEVIAHIFRGMNE